MMLYLIRHGESTGNRQRLLFGASDHMLTDLGRSQAEMVRSKMADVALDACFCSPLLRASETARICFEGRGIDIIPCPELREQHMGCFEDTDFPTLQKEHPEVMFAVMNGWYHYLPDGGERFSDVCSRAVSGLNAILQHGGNIAIVAHNGPLCAITAYLLGTDPARFDSFYFSHGCYTAFDLGNVIHGNRAVLMAFNK